MNRTRDYYRFQRERVIHKKYAIQEVRMGKTAAFDYYHSTSSVGKLSKGKVHCSCYMCRVKSKDFLSHRDMVQKKAQAEDLDAYWKGDFE